MVSYQALCEIKEDGWWIAEVDVDGVRGCRVRSPRLAFLPDRVREALARLVDDAETAHLVLRIRKPGA